MAAVTRVTGTDARILIGGSVYQKFVRCEFTPRQEFAKARAAGDLVMVNCPTYQDYDLRTTVYLDGAKPYTSQFGNLGVDVAFAVKVNSGDTNGFISGTGYVQETPFTMQHDQPAEHSFTIIPDGNVFAYNQSP